MMDIKRDRQRLKNSIHGVLLAARSNTAGSLIRHAGNRQNHSFRWIITRRGGCCSLAISGCIRMDRTTSRRRIGSERWRFVLFPNRDLHPHQSYPNTSFLAVSEVAAAAQPVPQSHAEFGILRALGNSAVELRGSEIHLPIFLWFLTDSFR
jgi:hypothetical protein